MDFECTTKKEDLHKAWCTLNGTCATKSKYAHIYETILLTNLIATILGIF